MNERELSNTVASASLKASSKFVPLKTGQGSIVGIKHTNVAFNGNNYTENPYAQPNKDPYLQSRKLQQIPEHEVSKFSNPYDIYNKPEVP